MIIDYRDADLSSQQRALCDYAIKLTLTPAEADSEDVERLRSHGFSDEQITIAAQIISYFNYINRIADGLGVDHEPWMDDLTPEQWHQRRGKF